MYIHTHTDVYVHCGIPRETGPALASQHQGQTGPALASQHQGQTGPKPLTARPCAGPLSSFPLPAGGTSRMAATGSLIKIFFVEKSCFCSVVFVGKCVSQPWVSLCLSPGSLSHCVSALGLSLSVSQPWVSALGLSVSQPWVSLCLRDRKSTRLNSSHL